MSDQQIDAYIAELEARLEHYRLFVGKLAVAKDKTSAWYVAKTWAPRDLWNDIGFDLKTTAEQKAFIFE